MLGGQRIIERPCQSRCRPNPSSLREAEMKPRTDRERDGLAGRAIRTDGRRLRQPPLVTQFRARRELGRKEVSEVNPRGEIRASLILRLRPSDTKKLKDRRLDLNRRLRGDARNCSARHKREVVGRKESVVHRRSSGDR